MKPRVAASTWEASSSPPVRGRGLKLLSDRASAREARRPPCGGVDCARGQAASDAGVFVFDGSVECVCEVSRWSLA